MPKKKTNSASETKTVDPALTARALAKTIAQGDIVNFRHVFSSLSPARQSSPERFEDDRYAYLRTNDEIEQGEEYRACLELVRDAETWRHIETELNEARPPQLPAQLVLRLGDNALRLAKYTSAAQAYELLRIRPRMQEQCLTLADQALKDGPLPRAVKGYVMAAGLAYNYAAFPEPLPTVPDFQTRALMLHGEYPLRPEDGVAAQPLDEHLKTALAYLLGEPEMAARLKEHPLDLRIAFLKQLIADIDSGWSAFVERYRQAVEMQTQWAHRVGINEDDPEGITISTVEADQDSPECVTEKLLGRQLQPGEWWQYLKELALVCPTGVLFIARLFVGGREYLVPRFPTEDALARAVGLVDAGQ